MKSDNYIIGGVGKRLRKSLTAICMTVGIVSFLAHMILARYYYQNRPREPMPDEGMVYLFASKWRGASVYLTTEEYWSVYGLLVVAMVLLLFATVMNLRGKRSKSTKKK